MFASFTGGVRAGAGALSRKVVIGGAGGGNVAGAGVWKAVLAEGGAARVGALASRQGVAGSSASQLTAQRAFGKWSGNTSGWRLATTLADSGRASSGIANVIATGAGAGVPKTRGTQHPLATARRLMHAGAMSTLSGASAARALRPASIARQQRGVKTKIKPYSSWKRRFQLTASGKFIRKQKGKRHKSFGKTPKQRMRLRGTRLVDASLVQPMKKLGFKLR